MKTPAAASGKRPVVAAVVLAVVTVATLGLWVASAAADRPGSQEAARVIEVRDGNGDLLASVPLRGDRFAVRYRNSIYQTIAEERYTVLPGDGFRVVQIAAEQLAVIEEYYDVPNRARPAPAGERLGWLADEPNDLPVHRRLSIAATDLGERTLLVPGRPPLALWLLVEQDPTVVLEIKEATR